MSKGLFIAWRIVSKVPIDSMEYTWEEIKGSENCQMKGFMFDLFWKPISDAFFIQKINKEMIIIAVDIKEGIFR
jgi:hypothetical protein